MKTTRLTRATMLEAASRLASRDRDLARVMRQYGPPPLWARSATFATLALIILEQQVSLASARSAFDRVTRLTGTVTPDTILEAGPTKLRAAGVTRQKTRYLLELAEAIVQERLSLSEVAQMPDEQVRAALTTIPGIGHWTANIYLLMALRRVDVWPTYDLALRHGFARLRRLPSTPSDDELADAALRWRPYRSVAARLLWHYYLSERRARRQA